jgi:hypothetical protein
LDDHGKQLWQKELTNISPGGSLLAGNTLIVPTLGGTLYAFDANSGNLLWQYEVQAVKTGKTAPKAINIISQPIFVDNTLYVQSDDGSISAFRSDAIDRIGPLIYSVAPMPGSTINGKSISYKANVVDEGSGINPESFKFEIDGAVLDAVKYDPPTNGIKIVRDPNSDKEPIPNLKDGGHKARITVSDWRGNVTVKNWGFIVDNKLKNNPLSPTKPQKNIQPGYPQNGPVGPNGRYGPGGMPPWMRGRGNGGPGPVPPTGAPGEY